MSRYHHQEAYGEVLVLSGIDGHRFGLKLCGLRCVLEMVTIAIGKMAIVSGPKYKLYSLKAPPVLNGK